MTKRISTVAEPQLKARRTGLGKKSQEELINLILRKDKTERKLNSKIKKLLLQIKEGETKLEESNTLKENFESEIDENIATITKLNCCINENRKLIHHLTDENLSLMTRIRRMYYVIIMLSVLLVCFMVFL